MPLAAASTAPEIQTHTKTEWVSRATKTSYECSSALRTSRTHFRPARLSEKRLGEASQPVSLVEKISNRAIDSDERVSSIVGGGKPRKGIDLLAGSFERVCAKKTPSYVVRRSFLHSEPPCGGCALAHPLPREPYIVYWSRIPRSEKSICPQLFLHHHIVPPKSPSLTAQPFRNNGGILTFLLLILET